MALSPGSRLGPYEVAAVIGQGGMDGEVEQQDGNGDLDQRRSVHEVQDPQPCSAATSAAP